MTFSIDGENGRMHLTEAQPGVQLEGTEANAANLVLRENGGALELYDEGTDAVVDAWDLSPALENESLAAVDGSRNLQPEGAADGLAADATGLQYTGRTEQRLDASIVNGQRSVYLEAAKASSAGDEDVTVELYDGSAVVESLTITGASTRTRSADISGSLTAGDTVVVRWNVTTASATGGATFDAVAARLVVE